MPGTDSFPRRQARTRRFTLGEPRNIRVSEDGARVAFLRSSGPFDPVNALWTLEVATGTEHLTADPRMLGHQSAETAAASSTERDGRGVVSGDAAGGGRGVVSGEDVGGAAAGEAGTEESARREDLPAAERARRERVRESAEGIVSYTADAALTTAVFAVGGRLWRAELAEGGGPPEPLPAAPSAYDPRLSPDGRKVAYVAGPSIRVTGDGADRLVVAEPDETVSWGSAEFVAAEEMGRTRGHWWSPCGGRLLAARVDTAPVRRWWIADPASPDTEPTEVRYPAAGQANAAVGLAVFDIQDAASVGAEGPVVEQPGGGRERGAEGSGGRERGAEGSGGRECGAEGSCAEGSGAEGSGAEAGPSVGTGRVDIAWDEGGWEYLADARWTDDGLLLTVQTRDQRTLGVLEADPDTGSCRLLRRVADPAWVELVPGAPRLTGNRLVTVEDTTADGLPAALQTQRWTSDRGSTGADDRGPARRLCVDGEALTPGDVQVRAVHHVDEHGVVVTASVDPAEVHVARVGWDGAVERLTDAPGVYSVAVGGDTTVLVGRSMEHTGRTCVVYPSRRGRVGLEGGRRSRGAGEGRSERSGVARLDGAGGSDDAAFGVVLDSHAAEPGLDLNVEFLELGERRLVSALVMPAGAASSADDRLLPVLLDPYGGPHAQRVQRAEALFHTSQWFADQGFAVLVVDGRGTPGRGPAFERAVRGDLAGPVLEDQIDALHDAARRNPRLDLSRVAVRGWSFGGYLAALAVLRRPDVFSAAVAGAPVTDWRLYDTHYTERYLGHPAEEPASYERTDLTPLASGLSRPLLLIHGLADDNVVAAHTLRLSRALTESGRPHTVLPLSGVTHMTPQEEVAENLLLIQLRFLQEALGMET